MRVLTALDDSACARPVSAFAVALARVLGAEVDAVHVLTDGGGAARAAAEEAGVRLRIDEGSPGAFLLREARAEDVVATVVGRSDRPEDGPVGSIATALVTTAKRPVAVVPAGATHPSRLSRVLVPLEGTRPTSLAPRRMIELAPDSGLEVVILHVFEIASLPAFTDQPQHEMRAWAVEFLARYSPFPPERVRLETRVGEPWEHVVGVAREVDADVIALGWAQELAAGRARVVKAALEDAKVPVFLIPVTVEPLAGLASAAA